MSVSKNAPARFPTCPATRSNAVPTHPMLLTSAASLPPLPPSRYRPSARGGVPLRAARVPAAAAGAPHAVRPGAPGADRAVRGRTHRRLRRRPAAAAVHTQRLRAPGPGAYVRAGEGRGRRRGRGRVGEAPVGLGEGEGEGEREGEGGGSGGVWGSKSEGGGSGERGRRR